MDTLVEVAARVCCGWCLESHRDPRGASWSAMEEGTSLLRAKLGKLMPALLAVAGLSLACATPSSQPDPRQKARQAQARLDIGIDHLRNGRQALALRDFLLAQSLNPDSARIQLALGDGYLATGRMESSESHFR
ncbi:MAG: hypothetical protein VCB99_09745, partial [Myxococcota bacterium]